MFNSKLSESSSFIGSSIPWGDNDDLREAYPDYYPIGDLATFGGTVIVPASERRSAFPTTTGDYTQTSRWTITLRWVTTDPTFLIRYGAHCPEQTSLTELLNGVL